MCIRFNETDVILIAKLDKTSKSKCNFNVVFESQEFWKFSNPIYNSFFRDSPNPEYQYWLDNCTKEDEMPYFNETLNNYECYPLLTQGPCEPNEWFVLEESQPNKTVCVEKPCISESNSQDLGDSTINFNYEDGSTTESVDDEFEDFSFYEVLFNGECKSNTDFKACPSGQELLTNAFGIGKCGFQNNILKAHSYL